MNGILVNLFFRSSATSSRWVGDFLEAVETHLLFRFIARLELTPTDRQVFAILRVSRGSLKSLRNSMFCIRHDLRSIRNPCIIRDVSANERSLCIFWQSASVKSSVSRDTVPTLHVTARISSKKNFRDLIINCHHFFRRLNIILLIY